MSVIGNRIRECREDLGLTQEQLAQKLGYKSKTTINKIEKGINDITQSKVKAFADVLGTTPAYLMGWNDNKNEDADEYMHMLMKAIENATVTSHTSCVDLEKSERMNDFFEMLNDAGQDKAIEQVELLTKIPEYQKEPR